MFPRVKSIKYSLLYGTILLVISIVCNASSKVTDSLSIKIQILPLIALVLFFNILSEIIGEDLN